MAIGIGLDHGHQFGIWRSQGLQKLEIVFKGVSANLNPARAQ
jgi:hypothetical protein